MRTEASGFVSSRTRRFTFASPLSFTSKCVLSVAVLCGTLCSLW